MEKIKHQANKFSSSLGFIAAASGAAIGLANIWKFPYEAGANGGACFLIPYCLFTVLLGYPMLLTKAAFGRKTGAGMYDSYKNTKFSKHIGLISVLVCMCTLSFYNVVVGWLFGYGIEILKGNLLRQDNMGQFFGNYIKEVPMNLIYNLLMTLSVLLIIKTGIQNGIEKWSKRLMPIFIVVLLILIFYGLTLSGAFEGIKFYLYPNISKITMRSISSALSHSFFSLALGGGVMITYGAYARKSSDLVKDSVIITISDFFVAFLAGLLIFPFIFHKGLKPNEGPALVFIAIPLVFKSLGLIKGSIIGILFFLLLVFAAITSAISMLEVPTKYMMEKFKFSRTKSVMIIALICYCLGLLSLLSNGANSFLSNFININGKSLSFMDCIIKFIMEFLLPFSVLCFSLYIGNNWKKLNIAQEINNHNKYSKALLNYIYICIRFLAPILILIVLISNFV
ncbi:MAG: sodium-dependent transporter [Bacteroidetes bacterium]|nr:sodium-dependent transporter [Bacteroidota bacterium]